MSKTQWMIASVFFNAFLAALKIGWSIYSGSTVVVADAIHSLGDVVGAFFVYLAIRFAKHRSARFPYGMNKLEDIAAIVGGIVVAIAGYEIIRRVFFESELSQPGKPWETIFFMAGIIAITLIFYYFEKKAANKLNSPGVEADAANWLGDMSANAVVIFSMAGLLFHIPYIQQIAVLIIVLFVFHSAYEIMRNSILSLLDASADPQELQKIRNVILSFPMVREIQFLKVTPAGSVFFVTTSIVMDEKSLKEAHSLADDIAAQIKTQVENIEDVIIHFEPVHKNFDRYALLLAKDKRSPAAEFGKTEWLLFVDRGGEGKILNSRFEKNPYMNEQKGKGIRLVAYLIDQNIDYLIYPQQKTSDSNPLLQLLKEVGVELQNEIAAFEKLINAAGSQAKSG